MLIRHLLLILLTHFIAAQFPNHVDLQKVGEVIFNNEKHKILKPTVHEITDHFADFMQRSGNKHKNERVFLDDNGFRHFWSGLGGKPDIINYKVDNIINEDTKNVDLSDANQPSEVAAKAYSSDDKQLSENEASVKISDENARLKNMDINNSADSSNDNIEVKPRQPSSLEDKVLRNTNETNTPKPTSPTLKPIPISAPKTTADPTKSNNSTKSVKKRAKITLFCPFFGIITMMKLVH